MPVQAPDQFADLVFPRKGIDLSQAFAGQLPGTTPLGLNVRTFEAQTQRGRGGSRPGLSQYIPQQLPSGAHLIQHLNVIVDPGGDGLADIDDGNFPDPSDAGPQYGWGFGINTRNPGRKVRRGGNGRMRFKNKKKKGIVRVQSNFAIPPVGSVATSIAVSFNQPVKAGNLLVVVCPFSGSTAISDSLGNVYTNAPTTFGTSPFYYCVSAAAGACTVTNTDSSIVSQGIVCIEYSGELTPAPFDGNSFFSPPGPPLVAWTTGVIPVAAAGELLLGAFFLGTQITPAALVAGAGFDLIADATTDVGPDVAPPHNEDFNGFFVLEGLPYDVSTAVTGLGTSSDSFTAWGVGFKPKP